MKNMQIQTERCTIRRFTREDIDSFMTYRNNPDWMRHQGLKGLTKAAYEEALLGEPSLEAGMQLAIVHTDTEQLLGDLYLSQEGDEVWIGYTIHPAHARKGYAYEAVRALIDSLRDAGWTQIKAGVLPENTASIRLLEKLDFHYAATVDGERIYTLPIERRDHTMAIQHKVKLTVLRKTCYEDLQTEYLADPKSGACPYFEEGQVFMIENDDFFRMLHGTFCAEAWDCISRYVYAGLQGGSIMRG